jgi:hypothetical protein
MRKVVFALFAASLVVPAVTTPNAVRAENGQVAAGVAGGLLGGLLLGGALAPRPYFYGSGPVYVEASPIYGEPHHCYWTRGEPYWDDYRGVWWRPRVRVCD